MSLFKTRTPDYKGQDPNQPSAPAPGPLDWFKSLIRTPTPAYATRPANAAHKSKEP